MINQIGKKLGKLGFSEKEVEIYLTCLESGSGLFVVDIEKSTKIKRSTIDLTLSKLIHQGLITHHNDGNRRKYVAEDPEKLLESFEETLTDLKEHLPLLYSNINKDSNPRVRFYHGQESILRMFDDIFLSIRISRDDKKEMLSISAIDQMNKSINDGQPKIEKKRLKENISLRILTPGGPLAKEIQSSDNETNLRKTKIFDDTKYPFDVSFNIYDKSISIFKLTDNPSGVIIEDEDLSKSMRSLFELMWDNMK